MTSVIVFFLLHGFTLSTWLVFLSFPPPRHFCHHFIYLTPPYPRFPRFPSPHFCFLLPHLLHSSSPICSVPPSFSASSPSLHFNTSPFPLTSLISMRSCFPLKQLPPRSVFGFIPFLLPLSVPFYPSSTYPLPHLFLHPFLSFIPPFLTLRSSLFHLHFTSSTHLPVYVPSLCLFLPHLLS